MSTVKTDTEEKNNIVVNQKEKTESPKNDAGKRASTSSELTREIHALIIYILRKYATEQKPLSPSEILKKIKEETGSLAFLNEKGDFNIALKTIRVHLDAMYLFSRKCDMYDAPFFSNLYFGKIHRYHLRPGCEESARRSFRQSSSLNTVSDYIRDTSYKNTDNHKTFYSFESVFSSQELLMLQSCVETNPYIDPHDSKTIIDKIKTLSEGSLYQNIWKPKETRIDIDLNTAETSSNIDDNSGKLMQNLTQLIYHIEMNHQIVITYGMYDYDFQKNFIKLVPKHQTKNGIPKAQIIDPVTVIWANGFCYLIAHTPKSKDVDDVIAYRVDRIISIIPSRNSHNKIIKIDPDVIDYGKRFNSLKYLKEHPVMYSGDAERIVMLVKNTERFPIVNLLYDTFGKNIRIYNFISKENALKYMHCSPAELKERDETWYTVTLEHSSVQGAVLWAKQHIDLAVIIAPSKAVELLTSSVREGLARYQ